MVRQWLICICMLASANSAFAEEPDDHAGHDHGLAGFETDADESILDPNYPRARSLNGVPAVATAAGLGSVFHVLDCTREGYITDQEVMEHGGVLFRAIDADRSGTLSRSEYVASIKPEYAAIRHAYFDDMDADGDGFATIHDYTTHLDALLEEADINGDGDTALAELESLLEPKTAQAGG